MITASISLVGVFISYVSVRKIGKQVEIQKKQWEYSQKPIFKIIKLHNFNGKCIFIVENSNSVFHVIDSITFTTPDVLISGGSHGRIETSSTKGGIKEIKDISKGLSITLTPQIDTFIDGIIQMTGKDIIGNTFICNSQSIKFNNLKLINESELNMSYLNYC